MKTIWSFDLGKASIGEAVRDTKTNEFLHKASLLIPAEFASTKEVATRRRMWRTRQAHKAREAWLDEVWRSAVVAEMPEPLRKREPGKVDANGNPIPKNEWKKKKGRWVLAQKADCRLEREFAPKKFTKDKDGKPVRKKYPDGLAKDGAPAAQDSDFDVCYNSALLRIKLLCWKEGEPKLEAWQVYKALHAAIQRRGQQTVPWIMKEAVAAGLSPEDLEGKERADLEKKDPAYATSMRAWDEFLKIEKIELQSDFHYPCYYDAHQMGLWTPDAGIASKQHDHTAGSTQKIVFPGERIEAELLKLAENAEALLRSSECSPLTESYDKIKAAFLDDTRERIAKINEGRVAKAAAKGREPHLLSVENLPHAKNFAELFVYGPAGKPSVGNRRALALADNAISRAIALRPGTDFDQRAAIGQKIPRFENRIINQCALIPRLHVCRLAPKLARAGEDTPRAIDPRSLLAAETTFLLQLKNLQVDDGADVRFLIAAELNDWLKAIRKKVAENTLEDGWEGRVLECYKITAPQWRRWCGDRNFKALKLGEDVAKSTESSASTAVEDTGEAKAKGKSDDVVKASRPSGRSRFSRPALAILRHLLVGSESPTAFAERLRRADPGLCDELGFDVLANAPTDERQNNEGKKFTVYRERKRTWLLHDDLESLDYVWRATDDKGQPRAYQPGHLRIPDMALRYLRRTHRLTEKPWSQLLRENDAEKQRRAEAITELIGEPNNPVVRDRLTRLWQRLQHFQNPAVSPDPKKQKPGLGLDDPECLVLEFVRDDKDNSLDGDKRVKAIKAAIERNEQRRTDARNALIAANLPISDDMVVRRMLFEDQGCACIFENDGLLCSDLRAAEIEHIVPRSLGGPDAYFNWVLCTPQANAEKANRVPYAWFHDEKTAPEWKDYKRRVQDHEAKLGSRKVDLLLSADAAQLVGEKYTALAETAWVARLAQSIARLHFGWGLDDEPGQERVITISGGLTARIRRKYLLDSLLGPTEPTGKHTEDDPDPAVVRREIEEVLANLDDLKRGGDIADDERSRRKKLRDDLKTRLRELASISGKNRTDKRHHVLDAMLLTFLPNWARDKTKEDFFRFADRNGDPIIGDNPLYSDEEKPHIAAYRRHLARIGEETGPVRDAIKAARERGDEAEMERLKKSIFDKRKVMAGLYHSIETNRLPRNIRVVREWFAEQLGVGGQRTPRVLPRNIAFEEKPPEASFYRRSHLVGFNVGKKTWDAEEQRTVPLTELAWRPDFRDETKRVFDLAWLRARVQAIVDHKNYKGKRAELKELLRQRLHAALVGCRAEKRAFGDEEWREIVAAEDVRAFFPQQGRGTKKRLPLANDCEVKVQKVVILPAKRFDLRSLAYKAGTSYRWNPEHYERQMQKLLKKSETPKKPRGGKRAAVAMPPSPNASPWSGYEWDVELRSRLLSAEVRQVIGTTLQPLLLDPKPPNNAPSEEKEAFKEQEQKWKAAWQKFVEDYAGKNFTVRLAPTDENNPSAKVPRPALYSVIFERQEQQFSVKALEKQSKSIPDRLLRITLERFAVVLAGTADKQEQERVWKESSQRMRPLSQDQLEFLIDRPLEDWLSAFASASRPRVKLTAQTAGTSLEEYADLSKDGSGLWAKGSNQGYWLAQNGKGDVKAHPIRFDESEQTTRDRLENQGWALLDPRPWRGGDLLELKKPAGTTNKPIKPGCYFLGSIQNETQVNLKTCLGGDDPPQAISLKSLWKDGELRQAGVLP